ncbi:FHA domain-containing protein, partial [Extibacter muris]|uniref:FHA domain-containing protein n=1 Tax=Extibacter muris TaxID=1796622 RepID=UPI00210DA912
GYVLKDNRSANWVMVNGRSITGPVDLKDKDLIQILDFQLFFSCECIYYKAVEHGISLRDSCIYKYVGRGK